MWHNWTTYQNEQKPLCIPHHLGPPSFLAHQNTNQNSYSDQRLYLFPSSSSYWSSRHAASHPGLPWRWCKGPVGWESTGRSFQLGYRAASSSHQLCCVGDEKGFPLGRIRGRAPRRITVSLVWPSINWTTPTPFLGWRNLKGGGYIAGCQYGMCILSLTWCSLDFCRQVLAVVWLFVKHCDNTCNLGCNVLVGV